MRKITVSIIVSLFGIFVLSATSWAMFPPVGTLSVERKINPGTEIWNIFFVARNKSGTPDFQAQETILTDVFFLFDYNTPPFDGGREGVTGPDGKYYEGFEGNTGVWPYGIGPGEQLVVNMDEIYFNFDDPYYSKVAFKSKKTVLAVLEGPFEYGQEIFIYPSQLPIKSPTLPFAPSFPAAPLVPNSPGLPSAPISPFSPNLSILNTELAELPTSTNPEPATIFLLSSGLIGFILKRKY